VTALELIGVDVERDGRLLVHDIDWRVGEDERWVVLGRNGSGKTTLVHLASLHLHPSRGTVRVLGEELGQTDVRLLRRRIGFSGAGMTDLLRPGIIAADVVMTARYAALESWWHHYDDDDRDRARQLLGRMGVGHTAHQRFTTLSSGERQRVLLARTLMTEPELLLLDEPTAGLDLGGREELVETLGHLAADPSTPPVVLVTHHLEEIPPGFTHALLVAGGEVQACGTLDEVVTADALSACFGLGLVVEHDRRRGRWAARAR
jgi:iron complex transport system ATP-binding protein